MCNKVHEFTTRDVERENGHQTKHGSSFTTRPPLRHVGSDLPLLFKLHRLLLTKINIVATRLRF